MRVNDLNLIACASGIAGADINSGQGPLVIRDSDYLSKLPVTWYSTIEQPPVTSSMQIADGVQAVCAELARQMHSLLTNNQRVCVIAGDHTSAIGTFSGVYGAVREQGDFGLIWLDAHMDSHTPETTESGNLHGMPLACLLGYGYPQLTNVFSPIAKLKPENVCLVGVRSFEQGEAELLKRLGVRVYLMEEVKTRGLATIMQEAVALVNKHTIGYGVSLDLDVIDPQDAPGVDVPEPDGVKASELLVAMKVIAQDKRLLATEIVEFDPKHDREQKTEKLVAQLIEILA